MNEPTTTVFLVAAPGLEAACAAEAACLDTAARVVPGGVELDGDRALVARANLLLRLPTRVLQRVGEVEARDFARLRRKIAALPWPALLPTSARVVVRATASRCRLYHTGAIAEQVMHALADSIGAVAADHADDDPDADMDTRFAVLARGHRDTFTLSLDTSGARLHQRGYRQEGGAAPLRETLAAAFLALAAHAPDEPLLDPLCGSGTLVLEAALRAIGRAPGLDRRFAFERFVGHDGAAWQALRDRVRAAERPRPLSILGRDADAAQIALAQRNAQRAGLETLIRFEVAPLASAKPIAPRGLLIANMPYGRRVEAASGALSALHDQLGRLLRGPFSGWRAAAMVQDRALFAKMGMGGSEAVALSNGGLRVWIGQRRAN